VLRRFGQLEKGDEKPAHDAPQRLIILFHLHEFPFSNLPCTILLRISW
jgi:hypothetical protein